MKKNIILLFMMVFSVTILKAQTKEQTIAWLKLKLTKYFQNTQKSKSYAYTFIWSLQDVVIDECQIVLKCKYKEITPRETNTYNYDVFMPTQDLLINSEGFYLEYDGLKYTMTASSQNRQFVNEIKGSTFSYFNINASGEVNLIERIQKAITHLAEFCPAKPKEAF